MNPEVIKIAKSLKCPYIKIDNNCICGTNMGLSLFSIVFSNSDETYVGTMAELDGKPRPDWVNIRYDLLQMNLFNKSKICVDLMNTQPIFRIDNIRGNESFESILQMKKSDGAKLFDFGYGIPSIKAYLTSGMIPANKSDAVNIDIYAYDEISVIVKFSVDKKKYMIHQFVRCRLI